MDKTELENQIAILAGEFQGLAEDMDIYRKLYEDPSIIPVLNKIAPRFFLRIQYALKDAVFLAVARATDPEESKSYNETRKNISIARICATIKSDEIGNTRARIRVNKAAQELKNTAKSIRTVRSRTIAHLDEETVLNATPLVPEGGFPLDEFVERSQAFLDAVITCVGIDGRYTVKRETYAKHADAFLHCLKYVDEKWHHQRKGATLRVA